MKPAPTVWSAHVPGRDATTGLRVPLATAVQILLQVSVPRTSQRANFDRAMRDRYAATDEAFLATLRARPGASTRDVAAALKVGRAWARHVLMRLTRGGRVQAIRDASRGCRYRWHSV